VHEKCYGEPKDGEIEQKYHSDQFYSHYAQRT
jgi:hypothetical protein